jgi:hypothetical protein
MHAMTLPWLSRSVRAAHRSRLSIVGAVLFAAFTLLPAAATHASVERIGFAECANVTFENPTLSEECISLIRRVAEPPVAEIRLDTYTISNYSYWRIVTEGVASVYDAPGGSVMRTIDPGFTFVIVTDVSADPWYAIQGGGYMQASDLSYVEPSYFTGVQLLNGLEFTFGWVMFDLFPASAPGGQQDVDTERLIRKYERFTVYSEVADSEGIVWYLVGENHWVEQRWVAIAKPTERPEGVSGRWVAIDLYEQTLVAYENDVPVFATLVATGLPNYDTREGVFEVWARLPSDPMSGSEGGPRFYALQNVPWVLYFDDGISLHGTYWHDGFGYRRSRGCVNLSISDARFIYEWTSENPPNENGDPRTFVYVYSSGEYGQFGATQA